MATRRAPQPFTQQLPNMAGGDEGLNPIIGGTPGGFGGGDEQLDPFIGVTGDGGGGILPPDFDPGYKELDGPVDPTYEDPLPKDPTQPTSGVGDIRGILGNIIGSGAGNLNEGALNSRLDSARTRLNKTRQGNIDQTAAMLAERGLAMDPSAARSLSLEDENIASDYGAAFGDIFADESSKADQRFQNALSLATGLTQSDVQAALENWKNAADFNLGQGQLALNTQLAQYGLQNNSIDQLIQLLQQLIGGAQVGSGEIGG